LPDHAHRRATIPGSCSVVDPLKRARASASSSSSLIPFPRVGRSVNSHSHMGDADTSLYFGQKRTGKSSLIPFPRVGRGGAAAWDLDGDALVGGTPGHSQPQSNPSLNVRLHIQSSPERIFAVLGSILPERSPWILDRHPNQHRVSTYLPSPASYFDLAGRSMFFPRLRRFFC
jgi:hypothetical protein